MLLLSFLASMTLTASPLMNFLFSESKNAQTEVFLLIKDDKILEERYGRGYRATQPHLIWSITKTLSGLLAGFAVEDGFIQLDDPVSKYVTLPLEQSSMTVRHILNMTSGFAWNEGYESAPFNSHVVQMLYTHGFLNMGEFVLKTPKKHEPGKSFLYSSGDTNLLMKVLQNAMPTDVYQAYPNRKLFEPLGIRSAVIERDASGAFIGSSYGYMTARDLSKIGSLILHDGSVHGKQIISSSWIHFMRSLSPGYEQRSFDHENPFGAHLWLNVDTPARKRPFPMAPESMMLMLGHEGQSVLILPEHNVVAVRFAYDVGEGIDRQRYVQLVLDYLSSSLESQIK